MASVLPSPALQASKAALSAALAENEKEAETKTNGDESPEPGEIQEVDMQAQADTIRTVFSDPTNFNVKVSLQFCLSSLSCAREWLIWTLTPAWSRSTRCTLPGRCGSIRLRLKVATSRKHP